MRRRTLKRPATRPTDASDSDTQDPTSLSAQVQRPTMINYLGGSLPHVPSLSETLSNQLQTQPAPDPSATPMPSFARAGESSLKIGPYVADNPCDHSLRLDGTTEKLADMGFRSLHAADNLRDDGLLLSPDAESTRPLDRKPEVRPLSPTLQADCPRYSPEPRGKWESEYLPRQEPEASQPDEVPSARFPESKVLWSMFYGIASKIPFIDIMMPEFYDKAAYWDMPEIFYDFDDDDDVDLDLFPCDLDTPPEVASLKGLREREPWTGDSGASQSVARKSAFPDAVLRESPGSRLGQVYRGPGKDVIPNEGEFDALSAVESGARAKVTFQAAEVRKPLVAVSSLVDKGNITIFDQKSFIIPGTCPEAGLIRELVARVKSKIPMYREKGVYKMRNWSLPSGFTRPGR